MKTLVILFLFIQTQAIGFQVNQAKKNLKNLNNRTRRAILQERDILGNRTKRSAWLIGNLPYHSRQESSAPMGTTPNVASPPSATRVNQPRPYYEASDSPSSQYSSGGSWNGNLAEFFTPRSRISRNTEPKETKTPVVNKFLLVKELVCSISSQSDEKGKAKAKVPEGPCDTFGTYITKSLTKLDPMTRNIAQYYISSIVFEAQMGIVGHNQQQLNAPPQSPDAQQQTYRQPVQQILPQPPIYFPFPVQRPQRPPPVRG